MRDNLPVIVALQESAMAAGSQSGQAWQRLSQDTAVLREHLDYLRERRHELPGDPALIAAAMGGMLATLAYALLPEGGPDYSDDEVVDTVTDLLLHGLKGALRHLE